MAETETFEVAVAGECMVVRPFAGYDERDYLALTDILRGSDFTYAHLEMNFDRLENVAWPAMGNRAASYMLADPTVAADLAWLGVDAMSLANNHSLDFGAPTMLATAHACAAAGIASAGTGADLATASAPAMIETPKGRVALLAAASGNHAHEWASPPFAGFAGRPGVNPQRVHTDYHIEPQAAHELTELGRRVGLTASALPQIPEVGTTFQLPFPSGEPARDRSTFVVSDHMGIHSRCHRADLANHRRSVTAAAELADFVIVAHHFNVADGPRGDKPPEFAVEFAHACIDAGAHLVLGHGWHRTLGIEIYRGRPICYGLGNFFAQSEFVTPVPYDAYEAYGHDLERLPLLTPAVRPLHAGVDTPSDTWWGSTILQLSMVAGQVRSIRLTPVELGRSQDGSGRITRPTGSGRPPRTEGRPFQAHGQDAEAILARLQRISLPLGTRIEIHDGIGTIQC